MGRFRKTARFVFSFGGYDGLSPIQKESDSERLARENNELLAEQNRILRQVQPKHEFKFCPNCGRELAERLEGIVHAANYSTECPVPPIAKE